MIRVDTVGPIRRFRMGPSLVGRGYVTAGYLVDGVMIDTGCAHTTRELLRALDGGGPHTIVNTHGHEDHYAGNAALLCRFGARAFAHTLALPFLREPHKEPRNIYRHVLWGVPEGAPASPVPDFVETERHRFDVVATPGHSADSISLFDSREGWLFTGDAFVGGRDRGLRVSSNVWEIIASLRRLRALGAGLMLTGSGTVYERPDAAIARKIEYLEETGERVLALHRRGLDERAIRRTVFGGELPLSYLTQGDFTTLALVRSYLGPRG